MNLIKYLIESRGPLNAARRLPKIATRFGVTPARMEHALKDYMMTTAHYGCTPTLAVTAVLVERYPEIFRRLEGAELAVHGYVHTDYSQLDEVAQSQHMERSLDAFGRIGLAPDGFRCPYLRWNKFSFQVADQLGLKYGSNRAIAWDIVSPDQVEPNAWAAYRKGLKLYGAIDSSDRVSLPSHVNGLLDIPASLPDDEAMVDRLALGDDERKHTWTSMLDRIYDRGELMTLILHHERLSLCKPALAALLERARGYAPGVWVAPLREIADWWLRRRDSRLELGHDGGHAFIVNAPDEPGITLLVRGVESDEPASPWFGEWKMVRSSSFDVRSIEPPVIVVEKDSPPALIAFLTTEGYIVRTEGVGVHIGRYTTFTEDDERSLIDRIDSSSAPLLRLWRWPNGARCALSITGDVDAMTLVDFLRRPLEV